MRHVIGIDMGATNIRVGVINENLEIVEVIRESTSHGGNDSLIQQIVRLIKQVHYEKYNISSITIGVPGRVRNDGYVYELPNIHVSDIDFVTTLQNVFHVPTFVINDAVAAGLAEAISGNGKDYSSVFFVTISSGIGGSFFVNKKFVVSSTEIGHTLFKYQNGYYELERIASGYGIIRLAELNHIQLEHGYDMFIGYQNHDINLTQLYFDWLNLLHEFLAFIQSTFSPEIIVFSGGVMKSASIFFEDLKKQNPQSKLIMAYHNQDAGLIGASCYGLQNS